ncbi:MAG TPA: BamA/TamA family outer membrane protein [Thiolinea sp.]|nr:BamA/TamA family outer membrane protein [Thiolinea sp.]
MHYKQPNKPALAAGLSLTVYLASSSALAQTTAPICRPWQESDAKAKDLIVGTIQIEAGNVFNPSLPTENHWYHRTANQLHIKTREQVIAKTLLFKTGDPFNFAWLAESERLLRAHRYLKDAQIIIENVCNKQVDLQVITSDNWTLAPALSFGRSGGNNSKSVSIEEHNLLGLGKELSLSFKQDEQRNQTKLTYNDPQVLGTHYHLLLGLQNNSDGKGHQLSLGLPFYKLAAQNAWGLESAALRQQVSYYAKGEVTQKIGVETKQAAIFYGWSKNKASQLTERYRIGWQQENRSYFPTATNPSTPKASKQAYPWISYELLQDNYTKRENFKTMGRTEDIALGHQFLIEAGFLHPKFGADDSYLKLFSRYTKGYSPASNQLSLIAADATTWIGKGPYQGVRANLKAEWNFYNSSRASWHLSGELHTADNLQHGEQLLLGGDNGLRGYPTGYRSGEHSALLSAERRYYFSKDFFGIAKLGAAAFIDAGTTWGDQQKANWFGDAGIGLRLIPTRSSSGKIIHLDLAIPFAAQGKVDKYQVLVGTGLEF